MKVAVLHEFGEIPKYEEFPDPKLEGESEVLVRVKASALTSPDPGNWVAV